MWRMRRVARLFGPLAVALALFSAACSRPRLPIKARPALWRVADQDTTIWLFGSIHALPPEVEWQTPEVARAIAAADTLILEIAPSAPDAARQAFARSATRIGLPPLLDRVDAGQRAGLERGIAASGVAPAALDTLKTWGAALAITAGAGRTSGTEADAGVEPVLAKRFAGRAIGALETRDGQFALFDRLPEQSQRFLLVQAARDAVQPDAGYRQLLAAWVAGNEAELAATLDPMRRDPALVTALVTARNARWASAIVRRMARPGRVFVAVGAGHLVGPESVVAMLRARGLRVTRIE